MQSTRDTTLASSHEDLLHDAGMLLEYAQLQRQYRSGSAAGAPAHGECGAQLKGLMEEVGVALLCHVSVAAWVCWGL